MINFHFNNMTTFPRKIRIEIPFQVISGPKGIKLTLDAAQIFIDNPGMGTPRLVEYRGETMTFDCAMSNVGEIIPEADSYEDAQWAYDWLGKISDDTDSWLDYHYNRIESSVKV